MRSSSTFGIRFIARMNKLREGQAPLYVIITVDSRRVELSLKRNVFLDEWNNRKGLAKGISDETKQLNHYLESVRARMHECYQQMQIQKQLVTAEAIKNAFLGIGQKEHTLSSVIEYHNTVLKDSLAKGTMKNYFTTQRYIKLFLKERYKTNDLFLVELRYKFITDFEHFLRNHQPKDHQKRLNNNGIMKHIERFRKIIRLAVRLEWLTKDPFAHYQQKFHKVTRQYLTQEELEKIESKQFQIERLQWIRDLFIFSCYTGLAYVDVMKLSQDNIMIGIDKGYWLDTSRQKTNNPVRIPLLPEALEIIEKYKKHPRSIAYSSIFPPISNQKLNGYLKEIADLCGINKNLTFHLARHTFATTVTLTNGVPIESVSKMLGHSRISTTQIYAKVIEKKLGEDMRLLKEKLATMKQIS